MISATRSLKESTERREVRAIKSVTTPIYPHPVRIDPDLATGAMSLHAAQPAPYTPPPPPGMSGRRA